MLVQGESRQFEKPVIPVGDTRILAEGRFEPRVPDQFQNGTVIFAVRIGEQRWPQAQLGKETLVRHLQFPAAVLDRYLVHMRMCLGLAADTEPGRLPFTNLVPVHIAGKVPVHRTCGNEQGRGESPLLQAGERFLENREICVVDGDGDRTVGKRLAGLQMLHHFVERHYVVRAGREDLEMLLELFERHIRARIPVLAKPVIHQDGGIVGGEAARRMSGKQCCRDEAQNGGAAPEWKLEHLLAVHRWMMARSYCARHGRARAS